MRNNIQAYYFTIFVYFDMKKIIATLFIPFCLVNGQLPIAVIDFDGKGITQLESSALTDRLRSELIENGFFKVVERGMMQEVLTEQGFQQTGCTSDECIVEVGRMIGVDRMIGGSISKVGDIFSVNAKIVSVETGEIFNSITFDLNGKIELLLSDGMKSVSYLLAEEEAPKIKQSSIGFLSNIPQSIKLTAISLWLIWGLLPPA
jgi:hypothetical protein